MLAVTTTDTGPVGLRELKKARTRVALQDAALALFVERGFDHTTVEEIADACEVSPRTFFRYFPTKEDVLFGDSQERCAALLDVVASQPPEGPALEVLHRSLREVALGYESERDRFVRRARVLDECPGLRASKAEQQRGWEAALVDELERRAQSAGTTVSTAELRLVAAVSMAAFRSVFDTWLDDPRTDFVGMLDDTFARLAAGLG
jgi:AcrR family transcriptional regulator